MDKIIKTIGLNELQAAVIKALNRQWMALLAEQDEQKRNKLVYAEIEIRLDDGTLLTHGLSEVSIRGNIVDEGGRTAYFFNPKGFVAILNQSVMMWRKNRQRKGVKVKPCAVFFKLETDSGSIQMIEADD